MTTLVKKSAANFRKQQAEAHKILLAVGQADRPVTSDERQFLLSVGIIKESGFKSDAEINAAVSRVMQRERFRSEAGLNGGYEAAVKRMETVSLDSEPVKKTLDEIVDAIAKLKARKADLEQKARKAAKEVERMEIARTRLCEIHVLPGWLNDSIRDAGRALEPLKRELSEAKAAKFQAELAIEFDAEIQKSDKTRMDTILAFAERHDCITKHVPPRQKDQHGKDIIESRYCTKSVDMSRWNAFVNEQRELLPSIIATVDELTNENLIASQEVEKLKTFWLQPDPWTGVSA